MTEVNDTNMAMTMFTSAINLFDQIIDRIEAEEKYLAVRGYEIYFNPEAANNEWKRIGLYQERWEAEEKYLAVRLYRGFVNLARGNKDEAIEDFEEVERLRSTKNEDVQNAILALMVLKKEKGDYGGVVERHRTLRKFCPEVQRNWQYQFFMADTYISLKDDIKSACYYIDRAMSYDKDKTIGMDELNFALSVFAEGREYEKISDLYNRYRSIYSEYPPLLVYAADAYFKLKEWEKVIETYNKLTQFVKGDSLSYGPYVPLTINNDVVKEVEQLSQLSQLNLYLENAEFLKASEVAKLIPDSIWIVPDTTWDVEDLYSKARFHSYVAENYERAMGFYNTIIEIEPSADAYSGRAYCYRKAGRMEEAKRDYQKVLELESDSVTWNTPYAYYFLGEKSMAKKRAEELLDNDSLSFDDYCSASTFFETIGKERKAYKLLKKALK